MAVAGRRCRTSTIQRRSPSWTQPIIAKSANLWVAQDFQPRDVLLLVLEPRILLFDFSIYSMCGFFSLFLLQIPTSGHPGKAGPPAGTLAGQDLRKERGRVLGHWPGCRIAHGPQRRKNMNVQIAQVPCSPDPESPSDLFPQSKDTRKKICWGISN